MIPRHFIIALASLALLAGCASAQPAAEQSPFDEGRTLRDLAALEVSSQLTVGPELARVDAYATFEASYESEGLTISALLHVPTAEGTHPGVVVVHGYSPAATYVSGALLATEQDALARAGFVVLYPDLRGLGKSDLPPERTNDFDMGATSDVIHALAALASADLPALDADHIGLLGHSLGGKLALSSMVAQPQLADAVVAFAPTSSTAYDSVVRYFDAPMINQIELAQGNPESNPAFWSDLSPITFADRSTAPLLVVHGTADENVPVEWSEQTVDGWQNAAASADLLLVEGETHGFDTKRPAAIEAAITFFTKHLVG